MLSGADVAVPLVGCAPLQPFAATHEVASVLDHVSVVVASALTTIGFAVSVTVGTGAAPTVTVAERLVEPPLPVHVIVNVVVVVSPPVPAEPDVATAPAHDALHELAFVLDHVSVEPPP